MWWIKQIREGTETVQDVQVEQKVGSKYLMREILSMERVPVSNQA